MSSSRVSRVWRPAAVVLAGLVVFGVLSALAGAAYRQNEQRLLDRQTDEAASVLALRFATILTPIKNAAQVADATDADPATFAKLVAPIVSDLYSNISVIDRSSGAVVASVGDRPALPEINPQAFDEAIANTRVTEVVVVDMLGEGRRLGHAVVANRMTSRFVVYFERDLNEVTTDSGFSDPAFDRLHYALYLGDSEENTHLIRASGPDMPPTDRRATTVINYGDTDMLLVTEPMTSLGSPLMHHLWWIVLVNGIAATSVTVFLLDRLERQRGQAMRLARESAARHEEQQDIAETLQLALLPERLQAPPQTQLASRYWTAGAANLIGGDFYDVFQIDDNRWGILIGDVCGKGIESASLIGLVRHTVRASAMYTDSPSAALYAVHTAMSDHHPPTFCTAAFMIYTPDPVDVFDASDGMGTLTIALAGHPQPVLGGDNGMATPIGRHGTLLGMIEPNITDETIRVRSGDTVLLYTDGLTDAPGEKAVGLDEVVDVMSSAYQTSVDGLADGIRTKKRARRPAGSTDDTAILVLRFEVVVPAEMPPEPVQQMPALDV